MLDTMENVWVPKRVKPKVFKGQPWILWQPKLDGWFVSISVAEDFYIFGRKIEAKHELSHELNWHPTYELFSQLPRKTAIHGELWVSGKPASCVVTAMKEHDPALKFTFFDVPWWNGHKTESLDRLTSALCFLKPFGFEILYPSYMGTVADVKDKCRDYEGAIFIDAELNRFKWKREETVDAIVIGMTAGKGKYSGMVGSLEVALYHGDDLIEIASVSGFTDDEREKLSCTDINRVCEVKYQYVGAGGRLRHPRFLRWRDDKPNKECTWDQLNASI